MMKLCFYLHALLIYPENRRTRRVICLTFEESLREPTIKAGIVLFLQLVAVLANAVHF